MQYIFYNKCLHSVKFNLSVFQIVTTLYGNRADEIMHQTGLLFPVSLTLLILL